MKQIFSMNKLNIMKKSTTILTIQIKTIFSLLYCLHTKYISILV